MIRNTEQISELFIIALSIASKDDKKYWTDLRIIYNSIINSVRMIRNTEQISELFIIALSIASKDDKKYWTDLRIIYNSIINSE